MPGLLDQIRTLDPSFRYPTIRPPGGRYDSQDIRALEQALRQAMERACYKPPGTNPDWGPVRFLKELHRQGYVYEGATRGDGGRMYFNPTTGDRVRIMPRPQRDPFRGETPVKFENSSYYRYLPKGGSWQPHVTLPDK